MPLMNGGSNWRDGGGDRESGEGKILLLLSPLLPHPTPLSVAFRMEGERGKRGEK